MTNDNTLVNESNLDLKRISFLNKEIEHLKQLTSNDCGVACLKMGLNYVYKYQSPNSRLNKNSLDNLDEILKELNIKDHSLWTIDIAHICAIHKIKHLMYTITIGVQENYSTEEFYSKERNFSIEKQRINQKFTSASQLGINITQKSVKLEEIKAELSKKCVCIVLIDAGLLNGKNFEMDSDSDDPNEILSEDFDLHSYKAEERKDSNCCFGYSFSYANKSISPALSKENSNVNASNSRTNQAHAQTNSLDELVESYFKNSGNKSKYLGHFIVLVGYDDSKNVILYRNPASSKKLSYTSYYYFEIARKTYGTDQDILFIYV